jgi:hypothetical protein
VAPAPCPRAARDENAGEKYPDAAHARVSTEALSVDLSRREIAAGAIILLSLEELI